MRRNSNKIVITLIVVLLLAGVGVGLYFLIEHIRKQYDDSKPKPKPDQKTTYIDVDDTYNTVCSGC